MDNLTGRRIALIGGAGFIGHNLAIYLQQRGAKVFIIDNLGVNNYHYFLSQKHKNPNSELYLRMIQQRLDLLSDESIPVIVCDARDYHALSRVFGEIDPDTVIHLAAVAHADRSNKDPYSTFDHSLRTLENALDNARSKHSRISHFVYFSCCYAIIEPFFYVFHDFCYGFFVCT